MVFGCGIFCKKGLLYSFVTIGQLKKYPHFSALNLHSVGERSPNCFSQIVFFCYFGAISKFDNPMTAFSRNKLRTRKDGEEREKYACNPKG
jgi:hypothetical protein